MTTKNQNLTSIKNSQNMKTKGLSHKTKKGNNCFPRKNMGPVTNDSKLQIDKEEE